MNRGAARSLIFVDDTDRRIFLIELRDACTRSNVKVHAYCLMPNHYHLLLFTPKGGLSVMMQQLSSGFTREYNKRHGRDGPIFRGRFKSVSVESDSQLIGLTRYIHLNPVEAGLVDRPERCAWSSAAAYVCDAEPPGWLRTNVILGMMGRSDAKAAYRELLPANRQPQRSR